MRFSAFISQVIVALALVACSTYADPSQLSQTDDGDALIIAERNGFGSQSIVLQRVDLENARFQRQRVVLSSNGDKLKSSGHSRNFSRRYIAVRAPAGDYAFVGTINSSFVSNGRRHGTLKKYNCNALGASVIAISPGGTYLLKNGKGRLARSSQKAIADANRALSDAGVKAISAEVTETKSIISFDAGRDLLDRLSASASCPQGDEFEVVARKNEVDLYFLSALWRPKNCKQSACDTPQPSPKAAAALAPAYRAVIEEKHADAIKIIDAAIESGDVSTDTDYATSLLLRIRSLTALKKINVAAVDAERLIEVAPVASAQIEPLRVLVASAAFQEKDYVKADSYIRPAMASSKVVNATTITVAAMSAAMVGDVQRAFGYLRRGNHRLPNATYAAFYKFAAIEGSNDVIADIARQYAADYSVSVQEAHATLKRSSKAALGFQPTSN